MSTLQNNTVSTYNRNKPRSAAENHWFWLNGNWLCSSLLHLFIISVNCHFFQVWKTSDKNWKQVYWKQTDILSLVSAWRGYTQKRKSKAALSTKGQVVQKVGQRSWWASGALMLSTLAHTHIRARTHTWAHTRSLRAPEEFLDGEDIWWTSLRSFTSRTLLQNAVFSPWEAAPALPSQWDSNSDRHLYLFNKLVTVRVKELN